MNDDEDPYVCPPGYILADCPACGYTNEVRDGADIIDCERCNLPDAKGAIRMLTNDQVSEIVASSVASACQRASDIATATSRTDWSLAELGAMIASETVSNTFCALFAEEEYRRAYELIASRGSAGDLGGVYGDDATLDPPDGPEQDPEGKGADGARG